MCISTVVQNKLWEKRAVRVEEWDAWRVGIDAQGKETKRQIEELIEERTRDRVYRHEVLDLVKDLQRRFPEAHIPDFPVQSQGGV